MFLRHRNNDLKQQPHSPLALTAKLLAIGVVCSNALIGLATDAADFFPFFSGQQMLPRKWFAYRLLLLLFLSFFLFVGNCGQLCLTQFVPCHFNAKYEFHCFSCGESTKLPNHGIQTVPNVPSQRHCDHCCLQATWLH